MLRWELLSRAWTSSWPAALLPLTSSKPAVITHRKKCKCTTLTQCQERVPADAGQLFPRPYRIGDKCNGVAEAHIATKGALMGGLWNFERELVLVSSADNKVPLYCYLLSYNPLKVLESGLCHVGDSLIQRKWRNSKLWYRKHLVTQWFIFYHQDSSYTYNTHNNNSNNNNTLSISSYSSCKSCQ